MINSVTRREIVFAFFVLALKSCLSQSICSSEACARDAEEMMSKMDRSESPCDNFYKFSCGNFKPEIPNHKTKVNAFEAIEDSLHERLIKVMSAEIDSTEILPFQQVKAFYQNCMDTETIESVGLQPVREYLKALGSWPVVEDNWNESNWSWQETVIQTETVELHASYLFAFEVGTNWKNTSYRLLTIDQPSLGLSREYLIKGFNDEIVQAYHSFQVDVAVMFGANQSTAEREMAEALEFEMLLANISLAKEDRRDLTKLFNPTTVKDLQLKFPSLDWVGYFNTFLTAADQIDEREIISMSDESLFMELYQILESTPKRIIANYLMWRAVLSTTDFLTDEIRNRSLEYENELTGIKEHEERWKECIATVTRHLPIAVSALYVRNFFNEQAKDVAIEMAKGIKHEFETSLKEVSWMDEITRRTALNKVEKMKEHIAYPSELLDDLKLFKYHENLVIPKQEYLRSVWNLNRFRLKAEAKKFREIIDKSDWETHSDVMIVNAFYRWLENSIQIPVGILQGQYFSSERARYSNFASIGYVIGHEITHGFDDLGSQYDSEGNLVDWWQKETKKAYLDKARCIIDQYGNYTEPTTGLMLDGVNSQGENIADNGGILMAYRAYQKWVEKNGKESSLPQLKLTPNQLFWLSVGQSWCSVIRVEDMKKRITTGAHSPPQFRIVGPLSNIPEFSADFHCPEGSPMNPAKKCKVW